MSDAECKFEEIPRPPHYASASADNGSLSVSVARDLYQTTKTYINQSSNLAVQCIIVTIMLLMLISSLVQTSLSIQLVNDVQRQTADIRAISMIKTEEHAGKQNHPPPRHNVVEKWLSPTFLPTAPFNNLE